MADPSFYYAIFKKFQAVAGGNSAPGFGHVNDDNVRRASTAASACSQTQDQYGLYHHLGPHATDYTVDAADHAPAVDAGAQSQQHRPDAEPAVRHAEDLADAGRRAPQRAVFLRRR